MTAVRSGAPWSGALIRFLADPAADIDPAAVPDWPDWLPIRQALGYPRARGALGRWLAPTSDAAARGMINAFSQPGARLALLPAPDAVGLMAMAAAWLDGPRLGGLIRRTDVAVAQRALGAPALAFATGPGRLFPRPPDALLAALPAAPDTIGPDAIEPGAALLGLAIGAVPEGIPARLRLRRPASAWRVAAGFCREHPANERALTAIRRLMREGAPAWSSWLN